MLLFGICHINVLKFLKRIHILLVYNIFEEFYAVIWPIISHPLYYNTIKIHHQLCYLISYFILGVLLEVVVSVRHGDGD